MTPIHEKRFQTKPAQYVRQLYRSGVSIDEIAYRLDCRKEQIVREVKRLKPRTKTVVLLQIRQRRAADRRKQLGLSE